jgi:hypothetical protein
MRIKFAVSYVAITPLLLSVAFPRTSAAQVNLQVQIGVPTIRFETPPALVEVSPGVQVVRRHSDCGLQCSPTEMLTGAVGTESFSPICIQES